MVVGCCKEIVHTWLSKFPAVQFCSLSDDAFGDIAGMESDLFSSYAESFCAALVVASISSFVIHHKFTAMLYPLRVSSMGINDVWSQYVDGAIVTTAQLESISENQGNGVVIEKMESSNLLFKELDVTDRNIITHLSKDSELPRKVEDTDCYWKWFASNLASGGASSLLFVYSLYYACTHLARDSKATKKGGERQFNGLVDVCRKTLKSDGIAGLYHGSIISCVEAIMVIKAMPERRLVSPEVLGVHFLFLTCF
ncbi:putative mitochondrial carrier domain-containing protein [Rosa chinensis]|uniref:ADP/ATP translocase n=1 Tax=Rosa chinensis TaxID=74649 RepID=A0A2P6QPD3_ROSCH|nr:uncharacterized protein LOC112198600 [Rosa chinensis]PRQ36045.1 putative mitochondrial carrier domain-containing protein [Rosa chinensis]